MADNTGNVGILEAAAREATRDFGLPTRVGRFAEVPVERVTDSPVRGRDIKFMEVPITIDKSVFEAGDEMRKDAGKDAGFWLLPRRPMIALANVFAIGARKYGPRGWEKGMEWSRVVDPMFRHLFAWLAGEKFDKTDGQHHLASVAWACLALMEYEETHTELDDLRRPADSGPFGF